jgi:hypothetical protein
MFVEFMSYSNSSSSRRTKSDGIESFGVFWSSQTTAETNGNREERSNTIKQDNAANLNLKKSATPIPLLFLPLLTLKVYKYSFFEDELNFEMRLHINYAKIG